MKIKELVVFIEGQRAGTLREDSAGKHTFQYDDPTTAPQLSLSLRRRKEPWTGKPVEAFIDGVLPDDRVMRQRIGRLYDVNANNPFALLTVIGLDCAGGAQFVPTDQVDSFQESASLRPISQDGIKQRLLSIADDRKTTWQGMDEHWSLNGAQDKIALRWQDGQWFEALGSAATTHIIKPGIVKLHEQAFNEYVCMKAIERLDVPVSTTAFTLFDDLPAIVSTRWDREADGNGSVRRIHQEDLCQVTGHMTEEKYQSQGGPSAVEIIDVMRANGLDDNDVRLFHAALILNFLMAGSDAHAKNYAILEPVGQAPRLAPLYDIASLFAYDTLRKQRKLAMSIGGEYNWERIELRHWLRLAEKTRKADFDFMVAALARYATLLPDAFADAAHEALRLSADTLGADESTQATRVQLVERIQAGIDAQCTRVRGWFE